MSASAPQPSPGPFSGLLVVDLTRIQLRDIPNVDALYFTMVNSNKRSLESWLKNNWPDMSKNGETDDVKREKRASTLLAAE